MTACRCDLERPLGALLSLDFSQIEQCAFGLLERGFRRAQHLRTLEVIDQGQQGVWCQNVQPLGPGRFAALRGRTDQPALPLQRVDSCRKHARNRCDPAIQGKLTKRREGRDLLGRHHAHRRQQSQRDRQVEVRALLHQIRRRQVHGDALGRQGQTECCEGAAHPLSTFADRLVGQAHHLKVRQAARHLDLNVDGDDLDALEGDTGNAGDQEAATSSAKRAGFLLYGKFHPESPA